MSYSEDWKREVDPDEFWALIELARRDWEAFLAAMEKRDRRGLIRIYWLYEEYASPLGQERFLPYTNPIFSEDSLDDLWEEVWGRGGGSTRACCGTLS